jgi:hypothetical protein
MTLTIGTWVYSGNQYTAQPFGYDETDTRRGLTARKIIIGALLTAAEWDGLLGVYDNWRNTRIQDPDSATSNSVGTTVVVSASANTVSWVTVPCWFISAPSGEQVGRYIQATVELVDAGQALQVLQAEGVKASAVYYYGTWTLGTTTLDLRKPPETYQDMPSMALTATGETYITGPMAATRVRQIEGDTTAAGWAAIQAWIETTIATRPAAGDWFPVSAPTVSAQAKIVGGARADVYTVSISVGQAR